MAQRTGTAATVSILASIGSYISTFSGHPVWGLVIALISICFGVIGMVMAVSPRVSGGIISIIAIILGGIGIIVSLLGIIGVILF